MPLSTVHVFVSSTSLDLRAERQAAETAVQRMRQTKFVGMEYFGSRDETTGHASVDEVDRSQVYVGIFGGRYGSGITEREYRRARERRLPCFIYFKDDAAIPTEWRETDAGNAGRLAALKQELRDPSRHTVTVFASPDDLAARLTADLHRWLFDNYLTPLLEQAAIRGDEAGVRTLAEAVRDQPALTESLAARGIPVTGDVIRDLLATGAGQVLQMIAGGTRQLSADYSGRVENFLAHYLGSPGEPVVFGGRRAELARLDAWLADPKASPYLAVTGPAGRGKSALLTRWSRSLLTRDEVAVVFFPVSVRFRTNLAHIVFPSLAAQLARLHSEQLAWDPNLPAEAWQDRMLKFLNRPLTDGRTLLLILDGLDEAAGWSARAEMFPAVPPPGLRVVVSARDAPVDGTSSWLRRLGWTRPGVAQILDLGVLSLEDVRDVLRSTSAPASGNGQEPATALYRASAGDPLIVCLYVEDARMRDGPVTFGDVAPGLDGYFDNWWDDQRELWGEKALERERETQAVLDLLACALGPVSLDDVRQVAPQDAGLGSSRIVEATLKLLERFVVGDGRKQGYVFSHPRLAAHFHGRLGHDEKQRWEQQFIGYGTQTLERLRTGRLQPAETSPYLAQYFGAHLSRSIEAGGPVESLAALLTDEWRRAREALEGGYGGFLSDVDLVWRAVEDADRDAAVSGESLPFTGWEVRCALCHASVGSIARNIQPELVLALVKADYWTPRQALAYARVTPDPAQRARAMAALVPGLPESMREDILLEALAAARAPGHAFARAQALAAVAVELDPELKRQVLNEARDAAGAVEYPGSRAEALSMVSQHLEQPLRDQAVQDAIGAVRNLNAPLLGGTALAAMTEYLEEPLKARLLATAFQILMTTGNQDDQAVIVASTARYLPERDRDAAFRHALALAHRVDHTRVRAETLAKVVWRLPDPMKAESLPAVVEAIRAVWPASDRSPALATIVPHLSGQLLRDALDLARTTGDEEARAEALAALAPRLEEPLKEQTFREAMATAGRIGDDWTRHRLMIALAPELPEPAQQEALAGALAAARAMRNGEALARVALQMAAPVREPLFAEAFALAVVPDQGSASNTRADAIARLAPLLPEPLKTQALDEVVAVARMRSEGGLRASLLLSAAEHLSDPRKGEVILEALAAARTAVRPAARPEYRAVEMLAAVGLQLPEPLKVDVLRESLDAASALEDERRRAESLFHIGPELPDTLVPRAMTVAETIPDGPMQALALAGLAAHLPAPLVREAITAAKHIDPDYTRGDALAALTPRLAVLGFPEEAIAATRGIETARGRAEALTGLASHLPDRLLPEAAEVACAIDNRWSRGDALAGLSARLAALPRPALHALMAQMLRGSRRATREGLLHDIRAVIPVVEAVGGTQAVAETARAVRDAGRWWP